MGQFVHAVISYFQRALEKFASPSSILTKLANAL